MEPRHVIAQVAGGLTTGLAIWWMVVERRRDWKLRRLPLMQGQMVKGGVLGALSGLGMIALMTYLLFGLELAPKDSPALIAAAIGWIGASCAGVLSAVSVRANRRGAAAWLRVAGDSTLQLEADGVTTTFELRPASVRAYSITEENVQFVVTDGEKVAHFWGAVGLFNLDLVTEGGWVQAQGPLVGNSMKPLVRWLRPFVTKEKLAAAG